MPTTQGRVRAFRCSTAAGPDTVCLAWVVLVDSAGAPVPRVLGFKPASTWGIRYATSIRDEVFMALELVPGALADAAGRVHLPAAFDGA